MNLSILPADIQINSQIIFLNHPRTNLSSPFLISGDKIYELLEVDRGSSSFLFAKQVLSNGKILLAVEFHPLFLALPLIMERKSEFYSIDGYFDDTDLKQIEQLIKPYIYLVCKQSSISGYVVLSFNEKMILDWLCNRISKLMLYFEENARKAQFAIEKDLIALSFDVMKHYIRASLAQQLREELQIRYPDSFQSFSSKMKSSPKSLANPIQFPQNSKNHASIPNFQASSTDNLNNRSQLKDDQRKKQLKKDPESKKKKKDIKIPKCSIESFFSPQKKK